MKDSEENYIVFHFFGCVPMSSVILLIADKIRLEFYGVASTGIINKPAISVYIERSCLCMN